MDKNPYSVLGVEKTASEDEIKSAYRKMAKQYHPDLHPDDPVAAQKMNEVNAAYDILSNPSKKAQYDAYGDAGSQPYNPYGGYGQSGYTQQTGSNAQDFYNAWSAWAQQQAQAQQQYQEQQRQRQTYYYSGGYFLRRILRFILILFVLRLLFRGGISFFFLPFFF